LRGNGCLPAAWTWVRLLSACHTKIATGFGIEMFSVEFFFCSKLCEKQPCFKIELEGYFVYAS